MREKKEQNKDGIWREVVQRTKAVTHAPERITYLGVLGEGCTLS